MKPIKLFCLLLFFTPFVLNAQSLVGDWKMEAQNEDGETWTAKLSIADDGTYTVDFGIDGKVDVKGKYEMEGNQIKVQDVEGDNLCPNVGVYSWTREGDDLEMTVVRDECEGRAGSGKMAFTKM